MYFHCAANDCFGDVRIFVFGHNILLSASQISADLRISQINHPKLPKNQFQISAIGVICLISDSDNVLPTIPQTMLINASIRNVLLMLLTSF